MAITFCEECKQQISDKIEKCPHCGYPVKECSSEFICKINGIEYNFENFYNRIMYAKRNNGLWGDSDLKLVIREMSKLADLSSPFKLCQIIAETEKVPNEYNAESMSEWKQRQQAIQASKIHCPNCHATNVKRISGTERAASVLGLGILSKKIGKSYKCLNCKYTW